MIKLSKKSLLLFISALAMAAFAMPSLSSASTFEGIGAHTLTSAGISFSAGAPLNAGASCTTAVFEVDVVNTLDAKVTNATFGHCTGTGILAGTTATVTSLSLPWTATPVGDGFTISGINIVNHFEGAAPGPDVTLEGSLLGGTVTNATHTVTYAGTSTSGGGLTVTALGSTAAATVAGDLRDDQNTLVVNP
jgi:hypothetical protein